ncbi:gamma-glutamyltransferase [Maliponia aquimaris]|uniref:Gamma-glutamyltranspeptidase n=1 Tax=Maliponia aquimaris TaxID=1673631 RepID=A0A238JS55_9RHOB|nr:gamma-glutamyltransferase [Maliponia aquimaris]SMX32682.1 Gamma-glutamyltranspeptidase precursor [Maliponia aquimaris]
MSALHRILLGEVPAAERRAEWLGLPGFGSVADALAAARPAGQALHASGPGFAIACGSPHAARIGADLLRAGGNAADAAAGAALAMMVADPPNASPAGRAHILYAGCGQEARAIDGATFAPATLPEGVHHLPDAQSLPIPGAVRAILRLSAEAGRLPLRDVVGPARDLAREGFAVPPELARIWAWRAPELRDPDARRCYLPGGRAPKAGETFAQPGLAGFFDHLIETGHDPFADPDYAGAFAARMADKGAFWTAEDLLSADPPEGETVTLDRDGWRLTSIGRQGWGHTLLRIAGLSAQRTGDLLEAALAHLLAILRAFEERPEHLRSLSPLPDPLPWGDLESRLRDPLPGLAETPRELHAAVSRLSASHAEDRDTTHLSVIDGDGMRVALTQSIGPHFGARVADPDTGILIAHSYRMAEAPAPGARDVTEQCPCLLDIGAARYALGGAGSERIPGAVTAVICGLLEGRGLRDAICAPRVNWVGDTVRAHVDAPRGLEQRLAAAGAPLSFTGRGPVDHLGIVQAAGRRADGTCEAAADPAYSGAALAG